MYFVYILECDDKSLYTGITTDVEARFEEHKKGKGAKYTKTHTPKKVVFTEKVGTRSEALKREYQIKSMDRIRKLELIHSKKKKI